MRRIRCKPRLQKDYATKTSAIRLARHQDALQQNAPEQARFDLLGTRSDLDFPRRPERGSGLENVKHSDRLEIASPLQAIEHRLGCTQSLVRLLDSQTGPQISSLKGQKGLT